MPYEEMKPEARKELVAKRSEREVARLELTNKVMAAFEDHRPKGRRFQVFVRHSPTEWADDVSRPPIEMFVPDPNAEMDRRLFRPGKRLMQPRRVKVPVGGGKIIHAEFWEDVNYKPGVDVQRGHKALWHGIRIDVPRDSSAEQVAALVKEVFAKKEWPLRE